MQVNVPKRSDENGHDENKLSKLKKKNYQNGVVKKNGCLMRNSSPRNMTSCTMHMGGKRHTR